MWEQGTENREQRAEVREQRAENFAPNPVVPRPLVGRLRCPASMIEALGIAFGLLPPNLTTRSTYMPLCAFSSG